MKSIMAKYNYAFGYGKSSLVLAGLAGLIAIVLALVLMVTGHISRKDGIVLLISGAIVLGIGVLVLMHTRSKCPPDKQGLVGLALSMCLVAFGNGFVVAFRVFGKVLGMSGNSGASDTSGKFANFYYRSSDDARCTLYSVLNEDLATLHDDHGNSISVHRGSFGGDTLYDDSGNSYRPC